MPAPAVIHQTVSQMETLILQFNDSNFTENRNPSTPIKLSLNGTSLANKHLPPNSAYLTETLLVTFLNMTQSQFYLDQASLP